MTSAIMSNPSTKPHHDQNPLVFDVEELKQQLNIPSQFVWPDHERVSVDVPELDVPLVDLGGFLSGDPAASALASQLIGEACRKHGFFLIVNHGVDEQLIADVHRVMDLYFDQSLEEKEKASKKKGEHCGYSGSFIGRFASKLPWKETLSLQYKPSSNIVEDYFSSKLGKDYAEMGKICQDYSNAMNGLCLNILELLGMSLGVERNYFKYFYEQNDSIFRLNHYPTCQRPDQVLGTGPHCDPTSLTILHQNSVNGLQVFSDGEWRSVQPTSDAFVVNIGDTLMALTNGIFKSCLHRAVVNTEKTRKSMTFFLNPTEEKLVAPPPELVDGENPRMYPDFRWPELFEFTQKHHRADPETLERFSSWIKQRRETAQA